MKSSLDDLDKNLVLRVFLNVFVFALPMLLLPIEAPCGDPPLNP